jgi:hypothetical protein
VAAVSTDAVLIKRLDPSRTSNTAAAAAALDPAGAKNAPPSGAMSGSVSRSSDPKLRGDTTATNCGVAHLFLVHVTASSADQRRTDEASRPDLANRLPGHPASFVRFVRTVGSPKTCDSPQL